MRRHSSRKSTSEICVQVRPAAPLRGSELSGLGNKAIIEAKISAGPSARSHSRRAAHDGFQSERVSPAVPIALI